jgi:hypothetical protein
MSFTDRREQRKALAGLLVERGRVATALRRLEEVIDDSAQSSLPVEGRLEGTSSPFDCGTTVGANRPPSAYRPQRIQLELNISRLLELGTQPRPGRIEVIE